MTSIVLFTKFKKSEIVILYKIGKLITSGYEIEATDLEKVSL